MLSDIEWNTGLVGSSARNPDSGLRIEFLHLVVVERKASVVLGSLPLELAALLVDVGGDERTLRTGRLIRHVDHNGDTVLARAVAGCDGVLAAIVPLHVANYQFAVVVTAVDLNQFGCPVPFQMQQLLYCCIFIFIIFVMFGIFFIEFIL